MKTYPERELISWPDAKMPVSTGKTILQNVNAIAGKLKALNIQKGDEVLIAVPVGPDLIGGILATMAVGAIPVLPPAGITFTGFYQMVKARKIKYILSERVSVLIRILGLTHNIKIISTQITANTTFEIKPEDVNPDQAALISHSSGSTGKSKAIYRSHRVLLAQHEVLNRAFPPLDNQKDFPLFPNILLHNLCNGTLSILPEIQKFHLQNLDAGLILNQLIAHQVTTITGNVFYFRRILEHAKQHHIELKNVRALGIGGSPVSEDLVFKLKSVFVNADIYIIYGSSEAEPMAIRKVDLEKQDAANGYCVGEIVSTISIKIEPIGNLLFKNGASIPVGEIEVKGPHVAVSKHEDWLKTGDYGYVYDQKLYLTGRKGNEIIYGGVQHYQVEHVLQQIEGIELAAALYSSTGFEIFIKGSVSKSLIRNVLKKNFLGDVFKKINFVEEIATDNRHLSKILYNKLASCVLSFIM